MLFRPQGGRQASTRMSVRSRAVAVLLAVLLSLWARAPARAQQPPPPTTAPAGKPLADEEPTQGGVLPDLGEPPALGELARRPIRRVEVVLGGGRWDRDAPKVSSVR